MIVCNTCQKAIELPAGVELRAPKHGHHICDDCGLLLDHVMEQTGFVEEIRA